MKQPRTRTQKAILNSSVSLLGQIVSLVCAFILPRLILTHFGSDYNGITSSISQFIECVVLLRAGVGGVTRAALYKPLANNDIETVSAIMNATRNFMRRVAYIFALGLFIFACIYPWIVIDEFDWFFSFSLVLILGISTFAQNYFGITYQMLIEADQKNYIRIIISIVSTIFNTIIAVVLINSGASIHIVKLGSAIIFSLNPICFAIYVQRKYRLKSKIKPDNKAIAQRWDAFAQQVAAFVTNNTAIVILTLFTDLKEISVYSVYYMIACKLKLLVLTLTNGIEAGFGNAMAKNENEALQKSFRVYEQLLFMVSTFAFGCAAFLIEPFVMVYTTGVSDVNYSRVAFGMLLCLNQYLYCVRLPYQMLAEAGGKFKETRNGSIVEVIMNIVISVVLVNFYGIIGVVIGSLCAFIFRTFQYVIFSSKNILHRSIGVVIKLLGVSGLEGIFTYFLLALIRQTGILPPVNSYFAWSITALTTVILLLGSIALFSLIFYRDQTKMLINRLYVALKRN